MFRPTFAQLQSDNKQFSLNSMAGNSIYKMSLEMTEQASEWPQPVITNRNFCGWILKMNNQLGMSSPNKQTKTTTEKPTLRQLTFKCQMTKIMLIMPLQYTTVIQSILCLVFLLCVATMPHQTSGQESKHNLQTSDFEIRSLNLA